MAEVTVVSSTEETTSWNADLSLKSFLLSPVLQYLAFALP